MKSTFIFRFVRGVGLFCIGLVLLASIVFFTFPLPGHVPILMYHFIGSKEDARVSGNVITAQTFEKQMSLLKKFGYRVISMEDYEAILAQKRRARGREVVLTFDDGNISVADKAIPILERYQYPVTLFMISENLRQGSQGSMSLDRALDLKRNPLVGFGAHTRTHPFLSQIGTPEVTLEIQGSKQELESMLGLPMNYFAYPYGDFDQRSLDVVDAAGYRLAFTTSPKKLKHFQMGHYSLTRVKISESDSNPFLFWAKVSGVYDSFKLWRHLSQQRA